MKTVQTTAGPVKCRLYDLYGRRATLTRDVSNSLATVAKGTEVTVEQHGAAGRVGIETDRCKCCKVRVRMTGIRIHELVFEPFEHDPKRGKKTWL